MNLPIAFIESVYTVYKYWNKTLYFKTICEFKILEKYFAEIANILWLVFSVPNL